MKQQSVPIEPGDLSTHWHNVVRRRSFLAGLSATGVALSAGGLNGRDNDRLPRGDVAIIKFLAAAELVESDFWQQYNELGGVNGGNPAYKAALDNLDSDMPQYISDNTDDEMSHAAFLNAYPMSKGETPVNLDAFRTLPSSQATGAKQIGRLTNLMNLDVDTSWYTRYRSTQNPDLGRALPAGGGDQEPARHSNRRRRHAAQPTTTRSSAESSSTPHAGDRQHSRISFCNLRSGGVQRLHEPHSQRI